MLTLRQSVMSAMWATLVLYCLGVFLAVVFGLVLKRSPLWWLSVALVAVALVLSVIIAFLDELGFAA